MDWIPVAEINPSVGDRFLAAIPGRKQPVIVRWSGYDWAIMYGSRRAGEVTHVIPMPAMPEPYRWTPRKRRGKRRVSRTCY